MSARRSTSPGLLRPATPRPRRIGPEVLARHYEAAGDDLGHLLARVARLTPAEAFAALTDLAEGAPRAVGEALDRTTGDA